MSARLLPLNLFSLFPTSDLTLGGLMTSEIVPSYQWVPRSLLEPDAVLLLKGVDLFSFLVYIW